MAGIDLSSFHAAGRNTPFKEKHDARSPDTTGTVRLPPGARRIRRDAGLVARRRVAGRGEPAQLRAERAGHQREGRVDQGAPVPVHGRGTEFSESLVNKRLAPNETENWPSQTLRHAATGIVITSSRVEFKNDNSGAGDGLRSAVMSSAFPHSYICSDGHNYIHTIN
jgi:hypothetical protein